MKQAKLETIEAIIKEVEGKLCLLGNTTDWTEAVENIGRLVYGVNPPDTRGVLMESLGRARAYHGLLTTLQAEKELIENKK